MAATLFVPRKVPILAAAKARRAEAILKGASGFSPKRRIPNNLEFPRSFGGAEVPDVSPLLQLRRSLINRPLLARRPPRRPPKSSVRAVTPAPSFKLHRATFDVSLKAARIAIARSNFRGPRRYYTRRPCAYRTRNMHAHPVL